MEGSGGKKDEREEKAGFEIQEGRFRKKRF